MKMLSQVFTKSAIALMLSVIAGTSAAFGQLWMEETPRFPVYSQLIRQYKALKPLIDQPKLTADERTSALSKLKELRLVASQLKKNADSDLNGSEELKSRYNFFVGDIDRNIARLERLQPSEDPGSLSAGASIRLTANTTIFAPSDDVEFKFAVPAGSQGKVWVGLMRYCDPHRNIKFEDRGTEIGQFQPKSPREGQGVVTYSAPELEGVYQVRMFEKKTGNELASADFEVLKGGRASGPSPETAPSPEGNWIVEWRGAPSELEQTAFFVLAKGPEFKCWPNQSGRGCWYGFRHAENAGWTLSGISNKAQGSRGQIVHGVGKLEVEPSLVKIDYFPYVHNQDEVVRNLGTDSPGGTWTSSHNGKDINGQSVWRRAVPQVTRAVFHFNLGTQKLESATAPNEHRAEVRMKYDSFWWGPDNNMRGNRPEFRVDIYGENLWGVHYPWIDPRTRLELEDEYYICGNGERNRGWTACLGQAGGVVGISYGLNIWNGVKPGTKMLFLDGVPVTFELVVPNLCGQGTTR